MHFISDILYWISTGLLIPVILLLIYLFFRALLLIGGFFGQLIDRQRIDVRLQQSMNKTDAETLDAWISQLPKNKRSLFVNYAKQMIENRKNSPMIEKLLADFELDAEKDLALPKMLTKMGPMLGLMGTLIPMGPALVGLSAGDIASMAYNMQVAFATTVIGLFSSAIGFLVRSTKQRWHLQSLNSLEYLAALIKENREA